MSTVEVDTDSGRIRGVRSGGVTAFKGVPYGGPTSGDARFRPPGAPAPWAGVRDCHEYGPSCPQISVEQFSGQALPDGITGLMGILPAEPRTGEDCLVLNVWSPRCDSTAGLPVLVWLHGGGWSTGSASWPLYEFDTLARDYDVVLVGVNHRLGILGFLDLSRLDPGFADSGNAGMLDVVAALKWVRQNIAGFGGDPRNVTVFGESGGGAKTATLLAMPQAAGLFQRAFVMSGVMPQAQTAGTAAANTQWVRSELDDPDVRELQRLHPRQLVEAEAALRVGTSLLVPLRGFGPVLGPSLPAHPIDAAGSTSAEVPLTLGCTTDEMLSFMFADPGLWTLSMAGLHARLEPLLGEHCDPLIDAYRDARPDDSPASLYIALTTDALMRIPHVRLAEAKAASAGGPAYLYQFAWGFPDPTGRIRSTHGSDMPYFFDNLDKAPVANGPHAQRLVALCAGALVAMARSGNPSHDDLPRWPAYSVPDRQTMILDLEPAVTADPRATERAAWEGIPAPGVGFIGE
jgi:para-nitrobenzyl esterase